MHFRGAGGGAEGDSARFQSRLGREVFMLTCKARLGRPARIEIILRHDTASLLHCLVAHIISHSVPCHSAVAMW